MLCLNDQSWAWTNLRWGNVFIHWEWLKDGVSNKYSKAKNKHLKYYDTKQEPKHIIYLDVNDLYGYAMSKTPSGQK